MNVHHAEGKFASHVGKDLSKAHPRAGAREIPTLWRSLATCIKSSEKVRILQPAKLHVSELIDLNSVL